MKKIVLFVAVLVVLSTAVFAGRENSSVKGGLADAGRGENKVDDLREEKRNETRSAISALLDGRKNLTKDEKDALKEEIKKIKEQKKAEFISEKKELNKEVNEVRAAVHALIALENMTGIGKNVSRIARDFDSSSGRSEKSLEKISKRGGLKRFFAGGDADSAKELEAEVRVNQDKIRELKQLRDSCNCDDAVKEVIGEQIAEVEKEQEKIQSAAVKEKSSKGLFGWLWK